LQIASREASDEFRTIGCIFIKTYQKDYDHEKFMGVRQILPSLGGRA